MMGYANNNAKIKLEQEPLEFLQDSPAFKKSDDSLDQSFIEFGDSPDSFLDSLLNFDGWVEDPPNSSVFEVMNSKEKPNLEIKKEEEVCGSEKSGDLGSLIQEGMDRVCLASGVDVLGSSEITSGGENGLKIGEVKSGEVKGLVENGSKNVAERSCEDSEEDSSSSSSSSSSDDDEEEENEDEDDSEDEEEGVKGINKVKDEVEMEEGEIREEMVSWSEDEDGVVAKGPVRSKNEVQDLPPVPPVNVTIESHHQTLPVGVVLSIIGAQVIVEGVEDHNPLSEGSILWITESRSPLGVVDEIFGPVKNPYYMVRYNSESEVPMGIQQGNLISFVPEFADYVLNDNNLFKKGYDASGENDEELSDELEFSDDEKEAEYKRMIKMSKRASNEQKNGPMKKDKKLRNRGGNRKNESGSSNGPTGGMGGNWKNESRSSDGPSGGPGKSPVFLPGPRAPNFTRPPGVWPNGFPSVPPQNMGFPPFMQQNFIQQPFQNLALPNLAPFHPQFNTAGQMFPGNLVPNFGANPAFASWPAQMPLNNFNQPQVGPPMAFQGFSGPPQGVPMLNGPQMENNGVMRPPFVSGNGETSQNPNQAKGFPNHGGRKPFQRGGGRFRGGRGRP